MTVAESALAPITLVLGPEDLLADRAVAAVVRAAREADAEADVRELTASGLSAGTLTDLTSPSLFGERKVIVLRGVQDAAEPLSTEVKDYLAAPVEDVSLVLVHAGGAKGRAVADAARKAGARLVDCAEIKTRKDKLRFVAT
jgi:DNA polymerase-3 subunit delta